jgi:hypothetical protein
MYTVNKQGVRIQAGLRRHIIYCKTAADSVNMGAFWLIKGGEFSEYKGDSWILNTGFCSMELFR